LFSCRPRPIPSAPSGTSSVTADPAAMYAPRPTLTGATRVELLPTNAPSSMTV
jgi:hypothetical protein